MKNDQRQDKARRALRAYQNDTEATRGHLVNIIKCSREELDTFFDEPGESSNGVLLVVENFLSRVKDRDDHAHMIEMILNRLGWRQSDLAERMDVRTYSVSRWTRGECKPKDRVWIDLFRILIKEGYVEAVDGPDLLIALVDADIEAIRELLPESAKGDV